MRSAGACSVGHANWPTRGRHSLIRTRCPKADNGIVDPQRLTHGSAAARWHRPLQPVVSWPFGYFTFSTSSSVHDLSKSGFSGP